MVSDKMVGLPCLHLVTAIKTSFIADKLENTPRSADVAGVRRLRLIDATGGRRESTRLLDPLLTDDLSDTTEVVGFDEKKLPRFIPPD